HRAGIGKDSGAGGRPGHAVAARIGVDVEAALDQTQLGRTTYDRSDCRDRSGAARPLDEDDPSAVDADENERGRWEKRSSEKQPRLSARRGWWIDGHGCIEIAGRCLVEKQ